MILRPSCTVVRHCFAGMLALLPVLTCGGFAEAASKTVRHPPPTVADTACELPFKGQHFTAAEVERGTFAIDLTAAYTTDQIAQIESNVKACQSLISSRLLGFQDKGSILMRDKASMEGMRNIRDQIETLKTLEAEKVTIRNTLGKDLAQVSLKGLYAVVLEADLKTPRDQLLDRAKRLIAPKAVQDLRGVAISSVSVVEESRLVFDRVVAETSGEMDVEVVAFEDRKSFFGKSQLLYVAVVRVNPLSGGIRKEVPPVSRTRGFVADLLSLKNNAAFFRKDLASYTSSAYATEKMRSLEEIVSVWQNVIQQGNAQANKKSGELLAQLARRIKEKDDEIKLTTRKIEDMRRRLGEIYAQSGFRCDLVAEECLDRAIAHLDRGIAEVVAAGLTEKAREMVSAKGIVIGAGDPEKEVQRLVQDFYQNLRTTYAKREQFLNLKVVESGMMADEAERQGYYIVRTPRDVSVYPYYDENGNMLAMEVMAFRVAQELERPKPEAPAKPPPSAAVSGPKPAPPAPPAKPERKETRKTPEKPKQEARKVPEKPGEESRPRPAPRRDADTDPETGMRLVFVEGGCYQMGSSTGENGALPPHEVCLDSFYMGKYEVTQGEWLKVMGSNPANNQAGSTYPVEHVEWHDAKAFITRLNQLTGRGYRLPTEAEWEYAARERGGAALWSGTSTESKLASYAWYKTNADGKTRAVGQKQPNRLGIYDLTGNVWEWVEDCANSDAHKKLDKDNPVYTAGLCWSVIRKGGSCGTKADQMTNASRDSHRKGHTGDDLGFRLVLPLAVKGE